MAKALAKTPRLLSLKRWFSLWLPLAMLSLLQVMTQFLKNRYQVSIQDMMLPVTLNLLTATIVTATVYRNFLKDKIAAYITGILVILTLVTSFQDRFNSIYPLFKALTPLPELDLLETPLFSILFTVLIFTLAYIIGKLASKIITKQNWDKTRIFQALTLTIALTFIFQFLPTATDLLIEWPQFFYKPPSLHNENAKAISKPDIYYIVLDRYASNDVLKDQFNFDNSDFLNYLQTQGYILNNSSHNNYPYTTMSIASTLNANYLTDAINKFQKASEQTIFPFHQAVRNAAVISELKALGYSYNLIGNWYETSDLSPLADHTYQQSGQLTILNHTFALDDFPKNELAKSVYANFIQMNLKIGNFTLFHYQDQGQTDMISYQLQTLHNVANQKPGGRFIFAHLLIPHDPYLFNADGSLNTNSGNDNVGEPIKEKYLQNLKYINSQITSVLEQINKASNGQEVVILQSDEGPYPAQLNDQDFDGEDVEGELAQGSMLDWSNQNLEMKFGNLAAYHIPKATGDDLKSYGNTVNIFRLVLNEYFNFNLPPLAQCYYAYPNGRSQPFVFKDITSRLTGQNVANCSDPAKAGATK